MRASPIAVAPIVCSILAPAPAAEVASAKDVDALERVAQRSDKPSAAPVSSTVRAGALAALLNHVYLTVDIGTYEAIRASSFLKDRFGVYEERTTKRSDITYTGLYFYGEHNYFEIFNEAGRAKPQPYAIAFGVDHEGDAKKAAPTSGDVLITRLLDKEQIPWFKMFTLPREQAKGFVSWMMEYVPEFLSRWHSDTGTPGGVSRDAVLRRYAATLGVAQADRLFQDISGLDMRVSAAELEQLLAMAHDFGCAVERTASGATIRTGDAEIRVTLGESTAISTLHFKLRAVVPAAEMRIGTSVLSIKADKTAAWSFAPVLP